MNNPSSIPKMSTSVSSTNSHDPPTPHSIDTVDSNTNSASNAGSAGIAQEQRFFRNSGNNNNSSESHHGQFHESNTTNNENQSQNQNPLNHFQIMLAQNHMFSPNQSGLPPNNHHPQHAPSHAPPGGDQHRPHSNTEQTTAAAIRESAEILDLDSHKVHVYQPPIPERHFFHSPYGLPPMFGNGWALTPEMQFSHGHHPPPPPHPGFGDHANSHYSIHGQNLPGQQPPPFPSSSYHHPHQASVYEMERGNPQFSSEPPNMDYPPPPTTQDSPLQPTTTSQNQTVSTPFGQPNGGPGFTPLSAQYADNGEERISLNSPLASSPAQKSPNEATTPAGSAAATAAKTKGWKGGECKRPKTYNCTACNKWFTSSGLLKRHYGTTLHKEQSKSTVDNCGTPITSPKYCDVEELAKLSPVVGSISLKVGTPVEGTSFNLYYFSKNYKIDLQCPCCKESLSDKQIINMCGGITNDGIKTPIHRLCIDCFKSIKNGSSNNKTCLLCRKDLRDCLLQPSVLSDEERKAIHVDKYSREAKRRQSRREERLQKKQNGIEMSDSEVRKQLKREFEQEKLEKKEEAHNWVQWKKFYYKFRELQKLKELYTQGKTKKCRYCSKYFQTRSIKDNHILRKHPDKIINSYKCEMENCHFISNSINKLNVHKIRGKCPLRNQSHSPSLTCLRCLKVYSNISNLSKHKKKNTCQKAKVVKIILTKLDSMIVYG